MAQAAQKLKVVSTNPAVVVEQKLSPAEAEIYTLLRQYRCHKSCGEACPSRIIIGQAGVVLDCPTCGWVGQTYPETPGD